ncbi:MAG: DUF6230 family protein [Haloarculaceae archaeon]
MAVGALLVLQTGTAYAVPLAGVGGFTIHAKEIRGYGAYIYGGVDDTSNSDAVPMAVTELQHSEIDGLRLVKTQSLDAFPGISGTMRITISASDTVTTGQQILKYTYLKADTATLRRQVIDETNTDNPRKQFAISARGENTSGVTVDINQHGNQPGLVLKDATINAHYLATNHITLPGQKIQIAWDTDGDGNYEHKFGKS